VGKRLADGGALARCAPRDQVRLGARGEEVLARGRSRQTRGIFLDSAPAADWGLFVKPSWVQAGVRPESVPPRPTRSGETAHALFFFALRPGAGPPNSEVAGNQRTPGPASGGPVQAAASPGAQIPLQVMGHSPRQGFLLEVRSCVLVRAWNAGRRQCERPLAALGAHRDLAAQSAGREGSHRWRNDAVIRGGGAGCE